MLKIENCQPHCLKISWYADIKYMKSQLKVCFILFVSENKRHETVLVEPALPILQQLISPQHQERLQPVLERHGPRHLRAIHTEVKYRRIPNTQRTSLHPAGPHWQTAEGLSGSGSRNGGRHGRITGWQRLRLRRRRYRHGWRRGGRAEQGHSFQWEQRSGECLPDVVCPEQHQSAGGGACFLECKHSCHVAHQGAHPVCPADGVGMVRWCHNKLAVISLVYIMYIERLFWDVRRDPLHLYGHHAWIVKRVRDVSICVYVL